MSTDLKTRLRQPAITEWKLFWLIAAPIALYMPYWRFVPYLPMFALAAGAYLVAPARPSHP